MFANGRFSWLGSVVYLIVGVFIAGCSTSQPVADSEEVTYVSYTGSELVRDQVKEGFESIKRIHNNVLYRTYVFDQTTAYAVDDLQNANIRRLAERSFVDDHSSAGTAIILSNRRNRTTLLTAAHTVTYPDTVWHYRQNELGERTEIIDGVSVIQSASHFFFAAGGIMNFDVVVADENRDLALLVNRWGDNENPGLEELKIAPGNHERLDWTDMVYALGYPKGIQMVTSAMVSNYKISSRRSFVLDASFNRGFSGGALFTVRGDGTGLEWVGILSAAYAENEYFLAPNDIAEEDYNPNIEYRGAIFPRRTRRINYGITYAVGMEQIGEFFRENRNVIEQNGLTVPEIP